MTTQNINTAAAKLYRFLRNFTGKIDIKRKCHFKCGPGTPEVTLETNNIIIVHLFIYSLPNCLVEVFFFLSPQYALFPLGRSSGRETIHSV